MEHILTYKQYILHDVLAYANFSLSFMLLDSYTENDIILGYMQELRACLPSFSQSERKIKEAVVFAQQTHAGQSRERSKRPFLHHPLKVSYTIAKDYDDIDLIIAAILHDTVDHSDNNNKLKQIYQKFGETIGYIVDALSGNFLYFTQNPTEKFNDRFEKLLAGGMKDIRCLLLQIYNNKHNFLSISGLTLVQQTKMSFETQAIYEPVEKIIKRQNKKMTHQDRTTLFKKYLLTNKVETLSDLKAVLISETFTNFDDETFFLAYNNPDKIVWEIHDEVVFGHILEIDGVDDKIDILKLEADKYGHFKVAFSYKTGHVFNATAKGKININAFIK